MVMVNLDLNNTTFIGIDAHSWEHTAVALNRFEEEKGKLTFPNTHTGISQFLSWIPKVDGVGNVVVGIEGGGTTRYALLRRLITHYPQTYELNPLYTKQRRDYGTRGDKSDVKDATLVAGMLTRKLAELPRILPQQVATDQFVFRKTVWLYEEVTERGAAIQNHLQLLNRECQLAQTAKEKRALTSLFRMKQQELEWTRAVRKNLVRELAILLPPLARNLTTMPGISTVLAAKIVAHVDAIERFGNIDKFIRYAGIAPLERSNGKTKKYIKANRGNRKLNAAIYMVALTQLIHDPDAKAYFAKKVAEGKTKKHALRCLMKRIACIVYGMLKSGKPYRRN